MGILPRSGIQGKWPQRFKEGMMCESFTINNKGHKLLLGMLRRLLCPLKPHVLHKLGIYCKVIRVAVPQSTIGGSPAPHVAISSILPPVPSYMLDRIKLGHFVDFTLLRPCNLKHLPVAEPSPVHLAKLAKSEWQPICTFQDWSEAWAVHGAIIAQKCPDKVADHYSYFLLLTSAHRDIPGMGWLVYGIAFRKHAAEKDFDIWREVMPTLWMTTVLSRGTLPPRKIQTKSQLPCLKWNADICSYNNCEFSHYCQICRGPHLKLVCPRNAAPMGQAGSKTATKNESSQASKHTPKCLSTGFHGLPSFTDISRLYLPERDFFAYRHMV
eukprot:gene10008-18634_t